MGLVHTFGHPATVDVPRNARRGADVVAVRRGSRDLWRVALSVSATRSPLRLGTGFRWGLLSERELWECRCRRTGDPLGTSGSHLVVPPRRTLRTGSRSWVSCNAGSGRWASYDAGSGPWVSAGLICKVCVVVGRLYVVDILRLSYTDTFLWKTQSRVSDLKDED